MLAGDCLRLRVLFLSFNRNDYRPVEKFWIACLPGMGRISPYRGSGELPRGRMAAPSPCLWASRAALEHLAASRRKRSSNPFLYAARHMEFIVRRCFFPYALVIFAPLGIMKVAFILSVTGANL